MAIIHIVIQYHVIPSQYTILTREITLIEQLRYTWDYFQRAKRSACFETSENKNPSKMKHYCAKPSGKLNKHMDVLSPDPYSAMPGDNMWISFAAFCIFYSRATI